MAFDDEIAHTMFSVGKSPEALGGPDVIGHYLVALEGAEPGRIVEVGTETITIGRDPRQLLVFADTELSRLHARVSLVGGALQVEDFASTNGTFIDGARIAEPTLLREGSVLRVGRQLLKYERRSRRDAERALELSRDLRKASNYMLSLLPPPLDTGPVLANWRFLPSAQLGGDAFGYYWLDADTFVFYLMDVSGHGVGPAMHSVTVMNVLRQRALPNVDFTDPGAVLSSLNDRFQMASHDGLFFTMWYGVYRVAARSLAYSAAGHHPAYLVAAGKQSASPLGIPNLMIGATPDVDYEVQEVHVPPESSVYLFSDGVFEIVTKEGERWTLTDFLPFILEPAVAATSEPERLHRVVTERAKPGLLDDDFSLVAVTFR